MSQESSKQLFDQLEQRYKEDEIRFFEKLRWNDY
jgi:hypothetical protein